jgi:hypothetical protein
MLGVFSPHYGTKRAILEGFNSLFVDNLIVLVAVIPLTPFSQEKRRRRKTSYDSWWELQIID